MLQSEEIKELVGRKAVELVEPGMTIGVGTGSTAYWFIIALAEKVQQHGFQCKAVPTSKKTKALALQHGITIVELDEVASIDLAIDGADEVNHQLQLIKGGGGALLQEKLVASASSKFIVIADESKYVTKLGRFPLPVEVVPYGWTHTKQKIIKLGCKKVELRSKDNAPLITDHGNYILDCFFEQIEQPELLESELNLIPGVIENGLFINMADHALIGYKDGKLSFLP